jgi:hypothetical protein
MLNSIDQLVGRDVVAYFRIPDYVEEHECKKSRICMTIDYFQVIWSVMITTEVSGA